MKVTIVVADDHELVRKSIVSLLRNEPDFDVVGECSSGREMLELIAHYRPAVAIIDVAMPELNGIETTKRIRDAYPTTRVVVLSNYTDGIYVRGMLDAGVSGYIAKSGAAHDLIQAVRYGTRGNVYLSPEVATVAQHVRLAQAQHERSGAETDCLSPREREVLQLIAEGYSSKRIAATLGISVTTVKSHRQNTMEKLDIHDMAGLTRYAIRIGLTRAE